MPPPASPLKDELEGRVFSFYPPVLNVAHNEWRMKEATWSELVVANTKDQVEIAVPRGFIGGVSQVDQPVMIVGLSRELEYKAGQVWPTARKVVPMPSKPMALPPRPAGAAPEEPGPMGWEAMVGSGGGVTESRISRLILISFGSLVVVGLLVWALVRFTPEAKPTFTAKDQSYLELTREDDYFAVVRRLGRPATDRWRPNSGELQYRALFYPDRGYAVLLMGTDQESARYIGTVGLGNGGKIWKPLHYVEYARGASTASMLRSLPPF